MVAGCTVKRKSFHAKYLRRREIEDDMHSFNGFNIYLLSTFQKEFTEISNNSVTRSYCVFIKPSIEDIFEKLRRFVRAAYRMSIESFYKLHDLLKDNLEEIFMPSGGHHCKDYRICTTLRLSAALRFFAGAAQYEIIQTHSFTYKEVYKSVWGVVDAVNSTKDLNFPDFFDHDVQKDIAAGFRERSAAEFDKIIGALDGMLVWCRKPTQVECDEMKIGSGKLKCSRKDKFGMNMQAACDSHRRFLFMDIHTPGTCSDFLAFETSYVQLKMREEGNILPGHVLIGDNAYIKSKTMATPIKNATRGLQDDYNFYISQCRIIIECAFGILVQRWGILRRPLLVGYSRVSSLMNCLCKLHNYCIDNGERAPPTKSSDLKEIRKTAKNHDSDEVTLDQHGRPIDLLNCVPPSFSDTGIRPARLESKDHVTMDEMIATIKEKKLHRPY